jgi:hypothetical protein
LFVVSVSIDASRPNPLFRILTLDGVPAQLSTVELAVQRNGRSGDYLAPHGWQAVPHWYAPLHAWWDGRRLKVVIGADLVTHLGAEMLSLSLRGDNLERPTETAFFWEEPGLEETEPEAAGAIAPCDKGTPILGWTRERETASDDEPAMIDASLSTQPAFATIFEESAAPSPVRANLQDEGSLIVRSVHFPPVPPARQSAGDLPHTEDGPRDWARWLSGSIAVAALLLVGAIALAVHSLLSMQQPGADQPPLSSPKLVERMPPPAAAPAMPAESPHEPAVRPAEPPAAEAPLEPPPATAGQPAQQPARPPMPVVGAEAQHLLTQGHDSLLAGRAAEANSLLLQAAEADGTGTVAMVIAKSLFDPVLADVFASQATVDPAKAVAFYRIAARQGKAAEAAIRLSDLKFWAQVDAPGDPGARQALKSLHQPGTSELQ